MNTTTRSTVIHAAVLAAFGLLLAIGVGGAASIGTQLAHEGAALAQQHPDEENPDVADAPDLPPPERLDPVAAALETARRFQQDGQLRDALSVCHQVLNGDPAQPNALELAVGLLIQLSANAEDLQDFDKAYLRLADARKLVKSAREMFEHGTPGQYTAETLTTISQASQIVTDRRASFREPLRGHIWDHLSAADQIWKDASPWYWANDLDKLSDAVRHLRDVRNLFTRAEDKAIESKFFEIYANIKSCVPEKQWNTVKSRGGMFEEK